MYKSRIALNSRIPVQLDRMSANLEDVYVDFILVGICTLIFFCCCCSGGKRRRTRQHSCAEAERKDQKKWLPREHPVHAHVKSSSALRCRSSSCTSKATSSSQSSAATESTSDSDTFADSGVEMRRKDAGATQTQRVIPRFTRLASIIESIDPQNLSISELGRVVHLDRVYAKLTSVNDVRTLLHRAGLQDNLLLVFGIDFTVSNLHCGASTFDGQSLHSIKEGRLNPYQSVIKVVGEALDGCCTAGIHAFGFGDVSSRDTSTVPLIETPTHSYRDVLTAYEAAIPYVTLSGPTSYSPLIRRSIELLQSHPGAFCTIVIITDGGPTNERENILAIREVSYHPMAVIIIGVGDGPWSAMEHFVGCLPTDSHCSFTEYHSLWNRMSVYDDAEAAIALHLTMKLPEIQKCINHIHLLPSPDD